jgi:hypothetical protein
MGKRTMKIKRIIIDGDEKELEFISRILCGVVYITTVSNYSNCKEEGLLCLETRKSAL